MKKIINILFILFSVVFFGSCTNTAPSIETVSTAMLYDYSESSDEPIVKMAVFVELHSDPVRINKIDITAPDNKYMWTIENPVSLENNNNVMVGTSNIMQIQNEGFPEGRYSLMYTDVAQRTTKTSFMVSELTILTKEDLKNNSKKVLVLYDKNNKLLYYGNRNSQDIETLITQFTDAKLMYELLVSSDEQTILIESKTEL